MFTSSVTASSVIVNASAAAHVLRRSSDIVARGVYTKPCGAYNYNKQQQAPPRTGQSSVGIVGARTHCRPSIRAVHIRLVGGVHNIFRGLSRPSGPPLFDAVSPSPSRFRFRPRPIAPMWYARFASSSSSSVSSNAAEWWPSAATMTPAGRLNRKHATRAIHNNDDNIIINDYNNYVYYNELIIIIVIVDITIFVWHVYKAYDYNYKTY